jgi:hypothetical protein
MCGPISGDDLSEERTEWLINLLRDTKCASLRAVYICLSSEETVQQLSKAMIVRWAQALEARIHRARGETKAVSCRLVLRYRPALNTPSHEITAAYSRRHESLDQWKISSRYARETDHGRRIGEELHTE